LVLGLRMSEVAMARLGVRRAGVVESIREDIVAKNFTTRLKIYEFSDIDIEKAVTIAMDNNVTVYDATYIALAQSIRVALATEDSNIIQVAPRYEITTLRLEDIFKLVETS
jgi:predicted nucleic acid-binding protein